MEDDDVEMEFISVMGVLVPMEVTNGLSAEAQRFVDGGFASSDGEKGGNLGQGISAHYQPQEVETEVEEQENTFTSNNPARGEPSCDKFPLRGNSDCTSMPEATETLVENEKRHQRIRMKRHHKKLRRKERLKKNKVEKKRSGEVKPTLPAKIEEKQAVTAGLAVTKRTTKKSKRVDTAAKTHTCRRNVVSTKPLVSASAATAQPIKHAAHSEDKAEVDSKLILSSKTAKTPDRTSDTWRLASDEETQTGTKKGNKSSTHSPARKTLTVAKKAAGKRRDEGVCAYPSCVRPATYKCRCAEHNTRPRCSHPNCIKFAHAGGKCIAHGGGPRCAEEGCGRRTRTNGRCYSHGGGVLCSHPKCTTRAKTKGKCIAHGGGTVCSQRGCFKLVTANGKCIAHGGGLNCSHPGCDKRAQLQGRCIEHSQADTADKQMKRFRGATSKAARTKVGVKRASKRSRHHGAESTTTEAAKDSKKPAKRLRRTTTSASTMDLRSGHRMPRISSERGASQRDLRSAEAVLQMVLELSKVEY